MKHLCYVYIYEYKCLKDIELVLDSRYSFRFSREETKLSIKKNEVFPTGFWGENISSIAAIIGNNGTGKSTAMSFLLAFLVEGSSCESLNGIIVFEEDDTFYFYGNDASVVFGGKEVEQINSSIGLKDLRWKIPCFYHSGHFTPNVNNDPRNSCLPGSYFASDNVRLVEDLQYDSNEKALTEQFPLSRYLNSHIAQNNYRICMMLSNKRLSDTITKIVKDFKWPRYVVIGINRSGVDAIENAIRNEKGELVRNKEGKTTQNQERENGFEVLDRYDKLLEYDNKAREIIEEELNEGVPDEATIWNDRAKLFEKSGDYEKAFDYFNKVLKKRESELGQNHLDTASTHIDIAKLYEKKGEYENALKEYEGALPIIESRLDENHIAKLFNDIARMSYTLQDFDKALSYCQKALAICESLGSSYLDTAYINIARVNYAKKDYAQALEYYDQLVKLRKSKLGPYDINVAIAYNDIAKLQIARQDYIEAGSSCENAKYIWETTRCLDHPDAATTYYNYARVNFATGRYVEAIKNYNQALDIRKTKLDSDNEDIVAVLNGIAQVYNTTHKYEKALECYNEVKEIRERKFGKDNPNTARTYYDIARIYSEMGDYDKALKYYEEAETVFIKAKKTEEGIKTISVPQFKEAFDSSSKDYYLSQLIYFNLLNIINDKWGWKNGLDIVNDWQNQIQSTTPILEQLDGFINHISDIDKKKDLKLLYDILIEIQKLTLYSNNSTGNNILYIDCGDNNDNLIALGEKVLYSNKFSTTSKFFELSYAQSLDSETILSSGEQELLNLFSRFYDAIVLRPQNYPNSRIPSLLMLDEAEIGFHPDWQRRYLKLVIDFLEALKETDATIPEFQIIISTHSPILLSDIPKCCTNYLKTENKKTVMANRDEIGETFAENVFQLYRRSFFMEMGLVGEFAQNRIKKLKDRIEEGKIEGVMNEIKMIGDDGIREFLMDEFQKKHPKDKSVKEGVLRYYKEKINRIKKSKE